ncbi:hypothetical protein V6N12_050996 [Hibiscus sabdariffa]|uniref:Uncharacterized protein n=1 Tax=Hibiscus sabdariffa TaxID=183260 RepID=A0ABR2GE03_9ROSI
MEIDLVYMGCKVTKFGVWKSLVLCVNGFYRLVQQGTTEGSKQRLGQSSRYPTIECGEEKGIQISFRYSCTTGGRRRRFDGWLSDFDKSSQDLYDEGCRTEVSGARVLVGPTRRSRWH